jgi:hypothetical protein
MAWEVWRHGGVSTHRWRLVLRTENEAEARRRYQEVLVALRQGNVVAEAVMLMEVFESTGLMVEPWPYSTAEFEAAEPGSFLYEEVVKKGIRIA